MASNLIPNSLQGVLGLTYCIVLRLFSPPTEVIFFTKGKNYFTIHFISLVWSSVTFLTKVDIRLFLFQECTQVLIWSVLLFWIWYIFLYTHSVVIYHYSKTPGRFWMKSEGDTDVNLALGFLFIDSLSNLPVWVTVTVVRSAVTDISLRQPAPPPPAVHSPQCRLTTSFLSTKSCRQNVNTNQASPHTHTDTLTPHSCIIQFLTSTAMKEHSPPCSV